MIVKLSLGSIRDTTWGEYASRFVFGGVVTLLAGLIADKFGPSIGGLFLAFPAIFPASASLIDKQQKEKKQKVGASGVKRGRLAAGVDAAGAALGCFGLIAFAAGTWKLLPHLALWQTLFVGTGLWIFVAIAAWTVRRHFC